MVGTFDARVGGRPCGTPLSRAVSEDFHGLFLNSFLPKSLFHRTELELTFIVHLKLMLIAFDFLQFSSHLEVKAPPDQSESFLGLAIYNLNSFFSSFFFGLVIFISSLFFQSNSFFFRLSFGSLEMDLFSPASYIDVCKGFADFFLWCGVPRRIHLLLLYTTFLCKHAVVLHLWNSVCCSSLIQLVEVVV